jgi:hypothetical protein
MASILSSVESGSSSHLWLTSCLPRRLIMSFCSVILPKISYVRLFMRIDAFFTKSPILAHSSELRQLRICARICGARIKANPPSASAALSMPQDRHPDNGTAPNRGIFVHVCTHGKTSPACAGVEDSAGCDPERGRTIGTRLRSTGKPDRSRTAAGFTNERTSPSTKRDLASQKTKGFRWDHQSWLRLRPGSDRRNEPGVERDPINSGNAVAPGSRGRQFSPVVVTVRTAPAAGRRCNHQDEEAESQQAGY